MKDIKEEFEKLTNHEKIDFMKNILPEVQELMQNNPEQRQEMMSSMMDEGEMDMSPMMQKKEKMMKKKMKKEKMKNKMKMKNEKSMSNYGISKAVELSYQDTVEKVKVELKKEGFGVLAELDMKNIFQEKLDKEINDYIILEACNPAFAFDGIGEEYELGLLLPCNVIVFETEDQEIKVAAIDPEKALGMSDNEKVNEIAQEIKARLERAIENV
ncbi:MAG: DUF302 domain-containing protein [Bacillota bacterium]